MIAHHFAPAVATSTLLAVMYAHPMTAEQLLEAYGAGKRDFRNVYLDGENLSYENLSGVDLTGAKLKNCNLTGTDLNSAILRGTYLEGTDLSDANLSGADVDPGFRIV